MRFFSLSISEKYQNIHLSFGITEVKTNVRAGFCSLIHRLKGLERKREKQDKIQCHLWYLHVSNISYLDFCFGIELEASVDLALDIKLLSEESETHLVKSGVAETRPRRQTEQQCIVAQGNQDGGKSGDKLYKRS